MSLKLAKSSIRNEIKKVLNGMTEESRIEQSKYIFKKILDLKEYKESKRVGIYLNMTEEVHTGEIIKDIFDSGKHCFIPRYNAKKMVLVKLYSLEDLDGLPKTKWNIKQPLESDLREDSTEKGGLDLIFVPGLAFTEFGERLGRGKGYYDRYLKELDEITKQNGRHLITAGLAYSEQIVDHIPTESTDFKLDQVLFTNIKVDERYK